jgi:hypothetical protein
MVRLIAWLRKGQDVIPRRFVAEFPERCSILLEMLEPQAREANLVGTFSVMVASSAFVMPFDRMVKPNHPLGLPKHERSAIVKAFTGQSFLDAPFWDGQRPALFRYAKIVNHSAAPEDWQDERSEHPLRSPASKDGMTVLRVIRNALAHGNILYLDEQGRKLPGNLVRFLAFLSAHDDNRSYRVVIFGEEDFLIFLKSWIAWARKM